MKNPISISTGCLHRLSEDRNKMVRELQKFSLSGVELSFNQPRHLLTFNIDKDNLEYLQTLKFNSIHAPAKDIIYGDNKTCKKVLQKISELYVKINAKNVVFHKNEIEDYSLIINSKFASSIENDDWRKPNNGIEYIKNLLDKYKELKLTFDFAHAMTVSPIDIPEYLDYFKGRLAEIHISIINEKTKRHDFMYKNDSEKLKGLTRLLKVSSAPLVLECAVLDFKDVDSLKKEMEYIKRI